MILGTPTIGQFQGEALVYRSQGAVVQPRSPKSTAVVMRRLEKRESNKFVALNQKIHELSRDNQQRQRVQAEFAQYSMRTGSQRVSQIVKSLRSFSRLDEAKFKEVNIHKGLNATLMILQSRLNPYDSPLKIEVVKEYRKLPLIHCAPGLLNQVFVSLLNNAIDAVIDSVERRSPEEIKKDPGCIWICSEKASEHHITVRIRDNGSGIPSQIQHQIFDPFFTTKPVGQGTGLGLFI